MELYNAILIGLALTSSDQTRARATVFTLDAPLFTLDAPLFGTDATN